MPMRREDCLDATQVAPVPLNGALPLGATRRTLGVEDRTGGQHFVMELPAGWRAPLGHNAAAQDIYLLEGELRMGGQRFVPGCYAYVPGGASYGPLSTEAGARLLVFADRPFEFFPGEGPGPDERSGDCIPLVETWRRGWVDPMQDIVKKSTWVDPNTGREGRPPGVLTKALRKGDRTGEVVALTVLAPGFVDPGTEHHPHNECLYLIAGDAYIGYTYDYRRTDVKEDLTLRKDCYIGRPPGIRHGPVCTQNGALWLVYLADMYTGIYGEVEDWEQRVGQYLASEPYR